MRTSGPTGVTILIGIGVFVLGIGTYLSFFASSDGDRTASTLLANPATTAEFSSTTDDEKTQEKPNEYRNAIRGFSLRYPDGLSVKEYDEGDGTYTIVFEETEGEKGFQIFVTPYLGDTITQSRIVKDIPHGKFTAPVEIVIGGGMRALAFSSTLSFGQMREVWFIHDGFLYEVTATQELDAWLADIIGTWRFLQ